MESKRDKTFRLLKQAESQGLEHVAAALRRIIKKNGWAQMNEGISTVTVFHQQRPIEGRLWEPPYDFEGLDKFEGIPWTGEDSDRYEKVALVPLGEGGQEALERAWELTNNIEHAWTDAHGKLLMAIGRSHRSSMVGDVFKLTTYSTDDGGITKTQFFMVDHHGFKEIK